MTRPLRTTSFVFANREYDVRYRKDGSGGLEDVSIWRNGTEWAPGKALDRAAQDAAQRDVEAEHDSARYDYEETEER